MKRAPLHFIALTLLLCSLPVTTSAWIPVDSLGVERLWFHEAGDSIALPYSTTHDLQQQHPEITRAIINVHGANRESMIAMANVLTAGNQHDRDVWGHTAVICPQFLFDDDIEAREVSDTLFFWRNNGDIGPTWYYGDQSESNDVHPRPFSRSSFACLDTLATVVIDAFPNLENLVFAGHSMGARLMQRYSMVTTWDDGIETPRILYNYANPAVYAYLGPERHVGDDWDQFAIPPPDEIDDCPEYDDWPFGMQDRFDYFADLTIPEIRDRYAGRHVIQWLSELDTVGFDGGSQTSCQAMMTGELYRLQRGLIFYNHVQWLYGGEPERFVQQMIPSLGHVGNAVYRSPVGRYFLFDYYDPVAPGENDLGITCELTVPDPETVDGIIEFSATFTNPSWETRSGDLWVRLVSWNGIPWDGWSRSVVFEPEASQTFDGQQFHVPDGFPLGAGRLYLYAGAWPALILVSDDVPVTITSTTSVEDGSRDGLPLRPGIRSISPNPFNASATVTIEVPRPQAVRLVLVDVLGREVRTVVDKSVGAGSHRFVVNGEGLASGVYFVRLASADGVERIRKLLLVR